MRGAAAEAEQAVFEANAIRVLEQQLRDAASALERSKTRARLRHGPPRSEQRAVEALAGRIADLERSGGDAIASGREDLATEVATVIAATEDERTDRRRAVERLDIDILRLRQLSDDGRRRLCELRRGLEMARAQEALSNRAGANGRRALATGTGALRDAEATLARIRENHLKSEELTEACDALDAVNSGRDLDQRLAEAGFEPGLKTKPADVLERLRRRQPGGGTSPASPSTPPRS